MTSERSKQAAPCWAKCSLVWYIPGSALSFETSFWALVLLLFENYAWPRPHQPKLPAPRLCDAPLSTTKGSSKLYANGARNLAKNYKKLFLECYELCNLKLSLEAEGQKGFTFCNSIHGLLCRLEDLLAQIVAGRETMYIGIWHCYHKVLGVWSEDELSQEERKAPASWSTMACQSFLSATAIACQLLCAFTFSTKDLQCPATKLVPLINDTSWGGRLLFSELASCTEKEIQLGKRFWHRAV